jgi:hypothetical protein
VKRALVLIACGAAFGYAAGFRDARRHDRTIVERVLDQAGASARGKYDPDLDRRSGDVEREGAGH